jgi:amino acid transporter
MESDTQSNDDVTRSSSSSNSSRIGEFKRSKSVSPPRSTLGILPMAMIIFFCVSGGPFGIEGSVRAAGKFYAIMGFAIMPFVWSIPEALMVAELGSAFPEASGGVAWVEEAFGSAAGFMAGKNILVSGVTDSKK